MEKIPTVFVRDWEGDRSRVLPEPTPGCEWVFAGEGAATRKYDGTACLIRAGRLLKRHEVKPDRRTGLLPAPPAGFEPVQTDPETGAIVGWVPVGDGPEDKWYREALARGGVTLGLSDLPDGTYELVGPKVQKNPEAFPEHTLVRHATAEVYAFPRTFEGMRAALAEAGVEGFVFHHPDGRMAKIKARDFGIRRQ